MYANVLPHATPSHREDADHCVICAASAFCLIERFFPVFQNLSGCLGSNHKLSQMSMRLQTLGNTRKTSPFRLVLSGASLDKSEPKA